MYYDSGFQSSKYYVNPDKHITNAKSKIFFGAGLGAIGGYETAKTSDRIKINELNIENEKLKKELTKRVSEEAKRIADKYYINRE